MRFSSERKWIVIKGSREKWKDLKIDPVFAKHAFFATEVSHQQVARSSHEKLKDKIVKISLSIFHNWKVYPWGSRELSRENLYVPLATGPFTHEQVAKLNTRARGWSIRLGWLVTNSPKQDNTVFWNFSVFVKTKSFLKSPKNLKKKFVFESTKIEHVKTHFNKYNHTNEYGIHWQ